MSIYFIYFIGAVVCFLLFILIVRYYNNGKGNMHSRPKVIALVIAIISFACGIFLANLSAGHYWKECLIDAFNNTACGVLGAGFAFIFKNNLWSIKKPRPFNKD